MYVTDKQQCLRLRLQQENQTHKLKGRYLCKAPASWPVQKRAHMRAHSVHAHACMGKRTWGNTTGATDKKHAQECMHALNHTCPKIWHTLRWWCTCTHAHTNTRKLVHPNARAGAHAHTHENHSHTHKQTNHKTLHKIEPMKSSTSPGRQQLCLLAATGYHAGPQQSGRNKHQKPNPNHQPHLDLLAIWLGRRCTKQDSQPQSTGTQKAARRTTPHMHPHSPIRAP